MADVIEQLQKVGLLDPKILETLSVPSPRESASTQPARGETI